MSYADAKSTARSPGAMGATVAAHVALGWAVLHMAGVTPDIIFTPEPIVVTPIPDDEKVTPPETPPQPNIDEIDVYTPVPIVDVRPELVETPITVTEIDTPTIPSLPPITGSGAGQIFDLPATPVPDPVYTASQLDRRYMARFQPPYPSSAKRAGHEGVVAVSVKIGTDGRVTSATIASSSGHESLDSAAIEQALKRWRFTPATRDGVAITSEQVIKVRFELSEA